MPKQPATRSPRPSTAAPVPPRINAARSFGCRPGSPVLFALAASGTGPLRFHAEPLPRGLKLDERTGQFTGRLAAPGRHVLTAHVSGPGGTATAEIVVHCGSRLALTPPMGWNSWNCWATSVSQEKVLASARSMAELLRPHGWTYVNIDDAWQGARSKRAPHALQPNDKFPDMAGLSDEVHALGLKLGIYSTPWVYSYADYRGGSDDDPRGQGAHAPAKDWWHKRNNFRQGLHSFAAADARQWAAWGIDYLKYDWYPIDLDATRDMSRALAASGRDIVFSLSNTLSMEALHNIGPHAQLWRTTGDIVDEWTRGNTSRVGYQGILDLVRNHTPYHELNKPGHWCDPDMLVLGHVGWGPNLHPTKLTPDEQTTHFALWCLWSAPLLIGCPLDRLDAFTLGLLTNDELIAINQDPVGVQAYPIRRTDDYIIYRKPLADGTCAYGLLNISDKPREITLDWKLAELADATHRVRDLVNRKDVGEHRRAYTAHLPAHGIAALHIVPA